MKLTSSNEKIFERLYRVGTHFLYYWSDLDGANPEFEFGRVSVENKTSYDVEWCVVKSTSGCCGLIFVDNYSKTENLCHERGAKEWNFPEDDDCLMWSSSVVA